MRSLLVFMLVAATAFVITVTFSHKFGYVFPSRGSSSCSGRCGDDYASHGGCQCSVECPSLGNCCSDYKAVCLTCTNRCTESAQVGSPCQCDSECVIANNCCKDYQEICEKSNVVGNITDEELLLLSEELYALDTNNVASLISLDKQATTSSHDTDDRAPNPLFKSVAPEAFTSSTSRLFETLRDNYNREMGEAEDNTEKEQAEVSVFLDSIMATSIMARLAGFMTEKRLINGTLRGTIEQIWFTVYSRTGGVLDSSGFEHVFLGELKENIVGGFHNWINFYREEQAGNIDYKGYIDYVDLGEAGHVFTNRFSWFDAKKPIGGGYIGASPEFELAMFTLCFITRPNSLCRVQTNGHSYAIQTWDFDGKMLLGTAYPLVA